MLKAKMEQYSAGNSKKLSNISEIFLDSRVDKLELATIKVFQIKSNYRTVELEQIKLLE